MAQGNLQFNQVIYRDISLTVAVGAINPQTQITFTVPSGKVWKIESMGCNTENYGNGFEINGIKNSFYANQAYSPFKQGPLWLSAGTTFRLFNNSNQPQNSCYISILEFNIVQ